MKKIRRCREHAHVLRDNEPCSFLKHSKHNKIEEMTKQEAEILDWVEMNTKVEWWTLVSGAKNNETGQERQSAKQELWFMPKKHYETKKDYFKSVVFNPQTQNLAEVIGDNFREMAGLIAEDIKGNVEKEDKWVKKGVVYQFCPDAICGDNPCSCRE